MAPLLYLTHRIPFPPNKGDKIRSYNLLRFLARHYRVFLGTFIDRPEDHQHVAVLRADVADAFFAALAPARARVRSGLGLLRGEPFTLPYYRDPALARWVRHIVQEQRIRKALVFSSAMAPYVLQVADLPFVADFCDVDSAKWAQYAQAKPWPASWLYRREARRLLAFERRAAARAAAVTFVTEAERALFARLAPECAARLHTVGNGVDADFFSPVAWRRSPFSPREAAIVFTGAMDYWPNVDAVSWFARDILPRLVARYPAVRFYVVGMNPSPAVMALARDPRVVVTGAVPDVRTYLQHAQVVVAPLRIARGVQNKVLEAMAMARPVVTTAACAAALHPQVQQALLVADDAPTFADRVSQILGGAGAGMGERARQAVRACYSWEGQLQQFAVLLDGIDGETALSSAQAEAHLRAPVANQGGARRGLA
ncbi:MAG: TIGR03087 family PEP-CTERM/XrtA system glycosyltransferase [Sutterellaceae bacterium]|nr:TIGR03087 family PEP-CTERM/XrtA system glycosyltransferase [Burkholderiaceae bacterium]MCX7901463.1 TIGR03087 family PEP-CTERM/XrtA system glycosyltransferase [Burkholderiaceae bacterium]MDW8429328.1 TIGR03087 family PEP-CTERM/XrtA system glycosyltransferase [Sutterellaceae bacterium]